MNTWSSTKKYFFPAPLKSLQLPIVVFDPNSSNVFLSHLTIQVDYAPGCKKQPEDSFANGVVLETFKQLALGNIVYQDQLLTIRIKNSLISCKVI
jgi:hypothetical protein